MSDPGDGAGEISGREHTVGAAGLGVEQQREGAVGGGGDFEDGRTGEKFVTTEKQCPLVRVNRLE